jgi:hypothetical protein
MDPRTTATPAPEPDPDAVAFIRFCYGRRRVGWPELYDEMCAVAARGLFRGLVAEDLAAHGIGFSLFDMPALAALSMRIVVEEQAARRPVMVVIAPLAEEIVVEVISEPEPVSASVVESVVEPIVRPPMDIPTRNDAPVRFVAVPAGA